MSIQNAITGVVNTTVGGMVGKASAGLIKEQQEKAKEKEALEKEARKREEKYEGPAKAVIAEVGEEFEAQGLGQRFYSPDVQARVQEEVEYARNFMETQRQNTNARLEQLRKAGEEETWAREEARGQERLSQNKEHLKELIRSSVTKSGRVSTAKIGRGYGDYKYKE